VRRPHTQHAAQECGKSNEAHTDCGAYDVDDPTPPVQHDRRLGADAAISGITNARG
jgi:hypothetical protein